MRNKRDKRMNETNYFLYDLKKPICRGSPGYIDAHHISSLHFARFAVTLDRTTTDRTLEIRFSHHFSAP